jgi:hypothetical protein
MLQTATTKTEKRECAKKLQTLANTLAANTIQYRKLADTNPTEDYSYGCILHDMAVLADTFYHLENDIKKIKLEINYLRCKLNKEIYSYKRTVAYNARLASYDDYDNIDF